MCPERTVPRLGSWIGALVRLSVAAFCTVGAMLLAAACDPVAPAPSSADEARPWFADETEQRGLDFTYQSGFSGRALLPEIVGGGVALLDVDSDDDLDIYLVQGGVVDSSAEGAAAANQLFLNDGSGHFVLSPDAGAAENKSYGMGVATGDYDGDGDVDLYVTNLGANVLLANDGHGRFEDVTDRAGVGDDNWGTAAAFADLDGDHDLDLYVVNYLHWSLVAEKDCASRGSPTYCAPTAYDRPARDRLYRNNGDGSFSEVSAEAGLHKAFGNGLGLVTADFNDDGLQDIFVANDRMVDQLWINQGGLTFRDEATNWGCAADDNGIAKAGMGVAAADVDDDGDEDLLVVNFEGETDSFYRNEGGYFTDVTARAGIATASRSRTRFGVVLADFDNDGVTDLFEANGKVDGNPAAAGDVFAEPNALFRGQKGDGWPRFERLAAENGPSGAAFTSRGLASGDLDNDGGLDLVVVNRDAPARLLMNRATRGSYLSVQVRTAEGAPALGAEVSITVGARRLYQVVRTSGSYLSAHSPHAHFGLGSGVFADNVTVLWPDGHKRQIPGPFADRMVVISRNPVDSGGP